MLLKEISSLIWVWHLLVTFAFFRFVFDAFLAFFLLSFNSIQIHYDARNPRVGSSVLGSLAHLFAHTAYLLASMLFSPGCMPTFIVYACFFARSFASFHTSEIEFWTWCPISGLFFIIVRNPWMKRDEFCFKAGLRFPKGQTCHSLQTKKRIWSKQ